jgi:cytochrome b6-f complex iron-sulfur subunit
VKVCTRCGAAFEGPGDLCRHCLEEEAERRRWEAGAAVPPSPGRGHASALYPEETPPPPLPAAGVTPPEDDVVEAQHEQAHEQENAPVPDQGLADQGLTRRRFLSGAVLAVGGAIGVGYLALGVRYLFPNVSAASTPLQDVGPVSAFPPQTPILKTILQDGLEDGVFVVNMGTASSPRFLALDFHCTHLNCPVNWYPGVAGVGRYICPCHGSQFTMTGQHVFGPAPRQLFRHQVVVRGGRVWVGGILA